MKFLTFKEYKDSIRELCIKANIKIPCNEIILEDFKNIKKENEQQNKS